MYYVLIICFLSTLLITPLVKKAAMKIGAIDRPNQRKVHIETMPRLGGLAIFISFMIGLFMAAPVSEHNKFILIGAICILLTGMLDDLIELSPKIKFTGQIISASVVIFLGGIQIEFIALPLGLQWDLHFLSIPFTFIWIIGITNSINFIDGLDGLASGVSSIALAVIAGMAFIMGDVYVSAISLLLLASTLGFLYHNFFPAKIFLGDSGSLFLGFMISVISLLGFKNVTFISLVIPIIILGVPLSDTFFAIIRRWTNKQPITAPDKYHLHHCLLQMGLSHRQTVLIIYGIAVIFGIAGIVLTASDLNGTYVFALILILIIELFAEKIGWVGNKFKPLKNFIRLVSFQLKKRY